MSNDVIVFLLIGGLIGSFTRPRIGWIDRYFETALGARTQFSKLFAQFLAMVLVGGAIFGAALALGCGIGTLTEGVVALFRVECSAPGLLGKVLVVSGSFAAGFLVARLWALRAARDAG